MIRRQPVAWLALFLAMGGTGVAAAPLVTGDDIQDRTIKSEDVHDGTLARKDFAVGKTPRGQQGEAGPEGPAGAQGPAGPSTPQPASGLVRAYVNPDGSVREGKGITSADVTRVSAGTYCINLQNARYVHATSSSVLEAQSVAADLLNPEQSGACEKSDTVVVTVRGLIGSPSDGPFHLLVDLPA